MSKNDKLIGSKDGGGRVMSEEEYFENKPEATSNLSTNFEEVKEVASRNISTMLKDLQAFEEAIDSENIPEIYRIYKGRLHKELKETSNQNHEIDGLLAKKLHDSFVERFPFMRHVERVSPTMHYYTISSYYRERPTIGFDASIPEIFVLPKIDEEWQRYKPENRDLLASIEKEIDSLEANVIVAETEVSKLNQQLKAIENRKAAIHNNKSFFNRGKIEEEIEDFDKKAKEIEQEKAKWLPYIENRGQTNRQKEQLMQNYQETRLKRAIVTKEYRLITKYFGTIEEMGTQIQAFLDDYLSPVEGGHSDE